jgi:hypothetical protein
MSDPRSVLERESRRFIQAEGAFERLQRRRDRKRRNQRVAAGVLGIAVFRPRGDRVRPAPRIRTGTGDRSRDVSVADSIPSPVTQPPSPFTERFDSPLHGLSIGYPAGWRTRAATEPWGHGEVAFGAPDVDVIFDPTLRDDLYFAVVSEPLGGRSGPDWVQALLPPSVGICKRAFGSGGHRNVRRQLWLVRELRQPRRGRPRHDRRDSHTRLHHLPPRRGRPAPPGDLRRGLVRGGARDGRPAPGGCARRVEPFGVSVGRAEHHRSRVSSACWKPQHPSWTPSSSSPAEGDDRRSSEIARDERPCRQSVPRVVRGPAVRRARRPPHRHPSRLPALEDRSGPRRRGQSHAGKQGSHPAQLLPLRRRHTRAEHLHRRQHPRAKVNHLRVRRARGPREPTTSRATPSACREMLGHFRPSTGLRNVTKRAMSWSPEQDRAFARLDRSRPGARLRSARESKGLSCQAIRS